ncbi:MAG TPA: hypothetical protein DCQ64_01625 [Candidatus Rokubacteria bacterium]|nr:hypothetical protein [Candidatus Rokubacteria bacterium]
MRNPGGKVLRISPLRGGKVLGNHTTPVPAPSTLLLLGGGLAGVALLRKRSGSGRR